MNKNSISYLTAFIYYYRNLYGICFARFCGGFEIDLRSNIMYWAIFSDVPQ